ncbi:MAG: sensor histidine kinase, partial [Waterburya sp.]
MQNWLLQNLSDVLNRELQTELTASYATNSSDSVDSQQVAKNKVVQNHYSEKNRLAKLKAQREWSGAIAAVEQLLLSEINCNQEAVSDKQGLIFTAPAPLLSNSDLITCFQSAVFTPDAFNPHALMPCRQSSQSNQAVHQNIAPIINLPLIPQDPISQEQFCLILTANFGLVMVLGKDKEDRSKFHFSFDPVTISEVWATLRSRLVITNYHHLEQLDNLVEQFATPNPDYRLVTNFSRQILQHLPDLATWAASKTRQVETIAATSES